MFLEIVEWKVFSICRYELPVNVISWKRFINSRVWQSMPYVHPSHIYINSYRVSGFRSDIVLHFSWQMKVILSLKMRFNMEKLSDSVNVVPDYHLLCTYFFLHNVTKWMFFVNFKQQFLRKDSVNRRKWDVHFHFFSHNQFIW